MAREMRSGLKWVVLAGLLVTAGLAVFVSPWANSDPDGLNRVAIDSGFADEEKQHPLSGDPVAGYSVKGVQNERVSTAISGLIGVSVTFLVAVAFFSWARRRGATRPYETDDRSLS